MNVVLIVMDTLRYDHVGANGNDWIQTPNLDRLAAESWAFDRCLAASFPTIPHRTDLITGGYGRPFHAWRPLPFDAPTLPRALADAGYGTQLIHDTPHLVNGGHNFDWPFHAWTPIRGAEVDRPWLDDQDELPEHWQPDPLFDFVEEDPVRHRTFATYVRANRSRRRDDDWNAAKLFRTGAAFLRANRSRRNFFLWLDCFDPHEPWDVPPEYAKLYDKTSGYDGRIDPRAFFVRDVSNASPAAVARLAALYAAKVTWADRWLGEFLDALDRTGLAGHTAVVLTADHGTRIGEYGHTGKRHEVREPEARVPLFIRVPRAGAGRCDALAQPQDITATVAAIAGCAPPSGTDGSDLVAVATGAARPRREITLCGAQAGSWRGTDGYLFAAFDDAWQLDFAPTPARCELRRLGSSDDVAAEHEGVVSRLHAAALDELARRGAPPELMTWLRGGGAGPFPDDCPLHAFWPTPAGYEAYFHRLYLGK
jgi:arylsulfatase A-like enzyme